MQGLFRLPSLPLKKHIDFPRFTFTFPCGQTDFAFVTILYYMQAALMIYTKKDKIKNFSRNFCHAKIAQYFLVFFSRKGNLSYRCDGSRTGSNARAQNVRKRSALLHHHRRSGNHTVTRPHRRIYGDIDAFAIIMLRPVRNNRSVLSERQKHGFRSAVNKFPTTESTERNKLP